MNILLTAIWSIPSINFIEFLRSLNIDISIIWTDINEENVWKYFVDKFYKVKLWREKWYINEIINICDKEKIDIIISSPEEEIIKLMEFDYFKKIKILHPKKIILDIITDKLKLNNLLIEKWMNYIKTQKLEDVNKIEWIKIIKKIGWRWGWHILCENNKDFIEHKKKLWKDYIIQEYIDWEEYSIDCIVDSLNNKICLPRKRISTNWWTAVITEIIYNIDIINYIYNFLDMLDWLYWWMNIQWFLVEWKFYITDFNPRFWWASSIILKNVTEFKIFFTNLILWQDYNNNEMNKILLDKYNSIKMIRSYNETFIF